MKDQVTPESFERMLGICEPKDGPLDGFQSKAWALKGQIEELRREANDLLLKVAGKEQRARALSALYESLRACPGCSGSGKRLHWILQDESETVSCSDCGGTGRIR